MAALPGTFADFGGLGGHGGSISSRGRGTEDVIIRFAKLCEAMMNEPVEYSISDFNGSLRLYFRYSNFNMEIHIQEIMHARDIETMARHTVNHVKNRVNKAMHDRVTAVYENHMTPPGRMAEAIGQGKFDVKAEMKKQASLLQQMHSPAKPLRLDETFHWNKSALHTDLQKRVNNWLTT